jgi:capsular exopolysaccharide synthesis family protein
MTDDNSARATATAGAVRRRWLVVAAIVVVTTGVALVTSLTATKQYDATVQVLSREQAAVDSLLTPNAAATNDPARDLNTAAELVKSGGTAHAVERRLRLAGSLDKLLDKVNTATSSDSDIISVRVRDTDPRTAALLANTFGEAYVEFRVASASQRYRNAAKLAEAQLAALSNAGRASPEGRTLAARKRELDIAAALQTGGAQIVRRASIPDHASRPRPLLSVALGVFLGLLLGLLVAVGLERLDRKLRTEEEVTEAFDLPILAAIPRGRRVRGGEDRAQREAYGLLAANLRFVTPSAQYHELMMITSASPAEGKTSVTLGTARALARLGLRVIAIEADLRRPTFGAWADVSASPGLTSVLSGETAFNDALVWVDPDTLAATSDPVSNGAASSLAVLPAGVLPSQPGRVLNAAALRPVLALARARADVVLVDTAPLGTVNDAGVLAELVGAVVVVARINRTTSDAVGRALRILRNAQAKLAGVVVTEARGVTDYGYYAAPDRARSEAQMAPHPGGSD